MISPLDPLSRAGGRSGAPQALRLLMRWTIQRLRLTVSTATYKNKIDVIVQALAGAKKTADYLRTNAGSSEVIRRRQRGES